MTLLKPCNYPGCSCFVPLGTAYCSKHAARPRFCQYPGCKTIITKGNYCGTHQPARKYDKKRKKRDGYVYDGNWKKLSKAYRKENALCRRCLAEGETVPALYVHHVKPLRNGGSKYDLNNLMPVCSKCHALLHDLLDRDENRYNKEIQRIFNAVKQRTKRSL